MPAETSRDEVFRSMPVNKALMTMAVPTIISQVINLVYNMVDTIFIGMTGDAYKTAAVTVAFTIFMLTISFSNLFGVGGGSLIARLNGRGEGERARSVCAFSFYGAIAVAALYSLLIGLFQTPILRVLGASDQTIEFARQYVTVVVVAGNVPVILSGAAAHLLRNAGYSKQAGFGLSMGGVLNIALDPLFMFVLLPEGMEVLGAALATLLANTVACVYMIIMMTRVSGRSPLSINPARIRGIRREEVRGVFSVGVPSGLLTALFDLANVVLISLMAGHGDLQVAAVGIVMKAERLPNAINVGLCQGMLPIVAYNYASGDHARMKQVMAAARKVGLLIAGVTIVMYECLASPICHVFLSTSRGSAANSLTTIALAVVFLRIRCLASPVQFLNYSTSFSMQAVGYGSGTMIHACVRELVFYIPFMYILNALFGQNGVASAVVVGEACGAAFALWIFSRWKKKHMKAL